MFHIGHPDKVAQAKFVNQTQQAIENAHKIILQTQVQTIEKEVSVDVVKYVEVPIEKIVEIIKEIRVEVPVETIKIVETIKEVPVEVKVEVIKEVEKLVEIIKEIPTNVIRIETKILEKVPMWAILAMVLELVIILGLLVK